MKDMKYQHAKIKYRELWNLDFKKVAAFIRNVVKTNFKILKKRPKGIEYKKSGKLCGNQME